MGVTGMGLGSITPTLVELPLLWFIIFSQVPRQMTLAPFTLDGQPGVIILDNLTKHLKT